MMQTENNPIPFEKIHGLGNDFIVINSLELPENNNREFESVLATKICNRNRGVGADGLIIIDQVKSSQEALCSWRLYNSDGTIAEMSGNGIRCAAKYIFEHGLSDNNTDFKIETLAGDIGITIHDDDMISVNMGAPRSIAEKKSLMINDFEFNYTSVSMGNPHAVSFFSDIDPVKKYGVEIEVHEHFPNRTNVEFAKILSPAQIDLVVWERGCGFTEACGTGACATVVSAILQGFAKKDTSITVSQPGGILVVNWDSVSNNLFMTGPAETSCVGYFDNNYCLSL